MGGKARVERRCKEIPREIGDESEKIWATLGMGATQTVYRKPDGSRTEMALKTQDHTAKAEGDMANQTNMLTSAAISICPKICFSVIVNALEYGGELLANMAQKCHPLAKVKIAKHFWISAVNDAIKIPCVLRGENQIRPDMQLANLAYIAQKLLIVAYGCIYDGGRDREKRS